MYWWNVRALAEELKVGTVSEYEQFRYLFAIIITHTVVLNSQARIITLPPILNDIYKIAFLIVVGIGLVTCYNSNKTGDNKHFIQRYIAISWPMSIQITFYLFLALLPALGIFIIAPVLTKLLSLPKTFMMSMIWFLTMPLCIIFEIIYYYRVNKKIKYISGAK